MNLVRQYIDYAQLSQSKIPADFPVQGNNSELTIKEKKRNINAWYKCSIFSIL